MGEGHIYKRTTTETYIDFQINNVIYRFDIPENKTLQNKIANAVESNLKTVEENFSLTSIYTRDHTKKMVETFNQLCNEYRIGRIDEAFILQQIDESLLSYKEEANDIPRYVSNFLREDFENLTVEERIIKNSKIINRLKQTEILFDEQINLTRFDRLYLKALEAQLASDLLIEKHRKIETDMFGFDANLSTLELEEICKQMNERRYIEANFKDFNIIFSGRLLTEVKPIIWCIKKKDGKPNKKALSEFLEKMLENVSLQTKANREKIYRAFVDENGKGMILNKKDDRYFSKYITYIETIINTARDKTRT